MRIAYVLTSLGMGGAERLGHNFGHADGPARARAWLVLVLRPRQAEEWLATLPVVSLDMHKTPMSILAGTERGRRFLIDFRSDLVHSHSFHANIAARLLKLLVPPTVVLSTVPQ